MQIIQIILLLFFAINIFKVLERKKKGDLSSHTALTWVLFWMLAVAVVVEPDLTFYLARLFGVGRGADLVVYLAIAGLFFLIFRLMIKIERVNREITKLVREKALKDEI